MKRILLFLLILPMEWVAAQDYSGNWDLLHGQPNYSFSLSILPEKDGVMRGDYVKVQYPRISDYGSVQVLSKEKDHAVLRIKSMYDPSWSYEAIAHLYPLTDTTMLFTVPDRKQKEIYWLPDSLEMVRVVPGDRVKLSELWK